MGNWWMVVVEFVVDVWLVFVFDVIVSVVGRCVVGKVYFVVMVWNGEDVLVKVEMMMDYGVKLFVVV